jgi:DNA repair photolyase
MAERYTPSGAVCGFDNPEPRPAIVESVKRQLSRGKIKGRTIQLCFTCDPYPSDIDTTPTRQVIEAIKNSGNHVQILTKGGFRAERDFDLLDGDDWFGVTITGGWKRFEDNSENPSDRLASITGAKIAGIKTWVSCEPVLLPGEIYSLIRIYDDIDLFKIGKLNYATSDIDWGQFGRECKRLCSQYSRAYYLKGDLRREMKGRERMTKEQLDAIRARCEAATPGPWSKTNSWGWCNAEGCDEICLQSDMIDEKICVKSCEHWRCGEPAWIPEILTISVGEYDGMNDNDVEFCAHARQDIPALLAALEAETKRADEAEKLAAVRSSG